MTETQRKSQNLHVELDYHSSQPLAQHKMPTDAPTQAGLYFSSQTAL